MRRDDPRIAGLLVLSLVCWLGCSPGTEHEKATPAAKAPEAAKPAPKAEPAEVAKPPVVEPPPKPTIPTVKLTDSLAATCIVKVGDALPEATLPNLAGKATVLRSLFGKKLTVVCFWKADNPYSIEELGELEKHVAVPYAAKDVRVVAIDKGDTPPVANGKFRSTGATFPCLLDANGAYFKQIATEKLPRTYLVDAKGKILWFDIEYSQSTQRDLEQAIEAVLSK